MANLTKNSPVSFTFLSGQPPYNNKNNQFNHPFLDGFQYFHFIHYPPCFYLTNAWWLAEISTLMYCDQEEVKEKLKEKGLTLIKWFSNPTIGTEACIIQLHSENSWIVAFRGTECHIDNKNIFSSFKNIVLDVITDLRFLLVPWSNGGKVHCGFKKAFESVWNGPDGIKSFLEHERKEQYVWFTGHSLGAALATLAAQSFGPNNAALYTFGSPRVGNKTFASLPFPPTFRFINHTDIICRLPPIGYKNVGQCKYFNELGVLGDNIILNNLLKDLFHALQIQFMTIFCPPLHKPLPYFMNDHVPVYYCNHTWNNMLKE
jgi:hypothetical protein